MVGFFLQGSPSSLLQRFLYQRRAFLRCSYVDGPPATSMAIVVDELDRRILDFEVTRQKSIDFYFIMVPLRNRSEKTYSSMVL